MREDLASPRPIKHGHIKVYSADDPAYVLLDQDNTIVAGASNLFARHLAQMNWPQMTAGDGPCWGVWGLVVGAGASAWANSSSSTPPPAALGTETAPYNPVKRKPLISPGGVLFLNPDSSVSAVPTTLVRFLTSFNATTDAINVPLMEMGLLGGGLQSANSGAGTDPLTAAFWNPTTNSSDSMTMLNFATFGSFYLPASIDIVFQWDLQM